MSEIEKKIKLSDPSKIDDNEPMRVGSVYGGPDWNRIVDEDIAREILSMNKEQLLERIQNSKIRRQKHNGFPFIPKKPIQVRYKQLFGIDYKMEKEEITKWLEKYQLPTRQA